MIPNTDIPISRPHPTQDIDDHTKENNSDEIDYLLVTALSDPTHRFFILKLDLELEHFLRNHHIQMLEFPPMSTFQRLIVHRVANYFKLGHNVSGNPNNTRRPVILHKTQESKIPVLRLSEFIVQEEVTQKKVKILARNPSPAPRVIAQPPAAKIAVNPQRIQPKRRNKVIVSDSPPVEEAPSVTSEQSKTLTRREVDYAKARARIFDEPFNEEDYIIIPDSPEPTNTKLDATPTVIVKNTETPKLDTTPTVIVKNTETPKEKPISVAVDVKKTDHPVNLSPKSISEPLLRNFNSQESTPEQPITSLPESNLSHSSRVGWHPSPGVSAHGTHPQGHISPDFSNFRSWNVPANYPQQMYGQAIHPVFPVQGNFPPGVPPNHNFPLPFPPNFSPQNPYGALYSPTNFSGTLPGPSHDFGCGEYVPRNGGMYAPRVGKPHYNFSEVQPGCPVEPEKKVPTHILELVDIRREIPSNDVGIEDLRNRGANLKKIGPAGPFIVVFKSDSAAVDALANCTRSNYFRLVRWSG
eukprot:CAMPEP_0117034404 /NCGR_PEP_ID=MMETSP0472-20121206/24497_1 /TAXON_ID=693140 ORGANISM="Tiarina fusus, Strain LIS" /NCGR_SAMPLE_ID=MMETSP0472 /ASSEMBLY_ACC=CAM_ASM_000603 /LENGTH=524 /DNA_ID=CAMNT_0004743565 /DNA_START=168 /DNA_END=1739 /DNA_ORIENTATION=+